MDKELVGGLDEDWAVIERILPDDWQGKAKQLRALFIPKEFKDAATLLRVMLIHLSDGCSLRETAVRARAGNLVDVSDVALLKRLRKCGPWFGWMCEQLVGPAKFKISSGAFQLHLWPKAQSGLRDARQTAASYSGQHNAQIRTQ